MDYNDFLNKVIDDGIAGVQADYQDDKDRLDGAIKGFEECYGKDPVALAELLIEANKTTVEKHREQAPDYWYWRSREDEIEWVCNVVSSLMAATNGKFPAIVTPTARGYMRMAEVVRKSEGFLAVREEA